MSVFDTSVVIDHLLATGVGSQVTELLVAGGPAAAPDVLAFEVLAVLRRGTLRAELSDVRATAAVEDLGDLAIDLFPSIELRHRAWSLRHNFTAADALFVALAESLGEPLVTKDSVLAAAARDQSGIEVQFLTG